MSYQDKKSENFAYYCREGKITFVKKWIDNPNVDVNWNYHTPLRNAVKNSHVEIIEMLLQHPKIKTDYQNQPRQLSGTIKKIDMKINPFTQAIIDENYDILDILVASGKFLIERTEHLDILVQMENPTMNKYFTDMEGFSDFIMSSGDRYFSVLSEELKELFVF